MPILGVNGDHGKDNTSIPRVLVVDDEPAVLGLVVSALRLQGFDVHAASSPLDALKLVHDSACFDLIVSDVIMPEMCGPELVRRVVKMCPSVAVVVMSAHIDFEATLPGHARFLSKPFRVTDLYLAVKKALLRCMPSAVDGTPQVGSTFS